MKKIAIPQNIITVVRKLETAGFEAFVVGGCVRDFLMDNPPAGGPKDWDLATNAKPEDLMKIFPGGKYENAFGTVIVPEKYLIELPIVSVGIEITKGQKKRLTEEAGRLKFQIKCPTYDKNHAEELAFNALRISDEFQSINKDILEVACLFHDFGIIKFSDSRHCGENIKILREFAGKIMEKQAVDCLVGIMQYEKPDEAVSLEQQILTEADIIEGINIERAKQSKSHLEWIKEAYVSGKMQKRVKTFEGKKLINQAIKDFNETGLLDKKILEIDEKEMKKGVIEITTYRIESKYSDKRHPDEVRLAKTLEEDLSRRDFTVNSMALKLLKNKLKNTKYEFDEDEYEIIDPFGGRDDLKNGLIRAVGSANERFDEDALRMMRAIRFAVQIGFAIEEKTFQAIKKNAGNLKHISMERIRDEFSKIIESKHPAHGVEMLLEAGLLKIFIPEFLETVGVMQNRHHYYGPYNTVDRHMLAALEKCPSEKLEVRLAAFLHDIGKPRSKRGEGMYATFHGHEYIGERLTKKIMERLKFPKRVVDKVVLLVKNHMFYYNVDEVGESGVRRVIQRVGLENINELIDVRVSDRLGSGTVKAIPYKLRHFQFMVDKLSQDPVSVGQLKINGNDLMKGLKMTPGPKIGAILEVLLARVIEEPELNEKEKLLALAKDLEKEDLAKLRVLAKEKIEKKQEKEEKKIKGKYWVK